MNIDPIEVVKVSNRIGTIILDGNGTLVSGLAYAGVKSRIEDAVSRGRMH